MSDQVSRNAQSAQSARPRRVRRLVGLAGLALIVGIASKLRAPIEERIRQSLAESAVAAGRLDEAAERLAAIIERHPGRPWPRFLQAQVARRRGQITEAEEALQRAIDLGLPVTVARPEHELLREAVLGDQDSAGERVVAGRLIRPR